MTINLNPLQVAQPALASSKQDSPEKIGKSAEEFESLLLAQLLKSARGDGGAWGTGEDRTAESVIDMAEEKVAEALAKSGGLGLARMVTSALQPQASVVQNGTPADKKS